MRLLVEVAKELLGMFLADMRLTIAILILVLTVAGLIRVLGMNALIGGVLLMVGCLAILVEASIRAARK